jgi:hypothetical protein
MGALFRNLGRAIIAATALAALTQLGPALADQANIVGYNVSFDIDYTPSDPTNLAGTPSLRNIVLVIGSTEELGVGGDFFEDWSGADGPLVIAPSSAAQTLKFPNPDLLQEYIDGIPVYWGVPGPLAPNHVTLLADYTDANGGSHVVVGMDPTAAEAVAGQGFDDIFAAGPISESALDEALQEVNTFGERTTGCTSDCSDALLQIFSFTYFGLQFTGTQEPYSDGYPALPGPFDLVSFSDGEIIGTATANLIPILGSPTTPIPEPSTWAMMLLGFAGLGYAGYRRSRSAGRPIG